MQEERRALPQEAMDLIRPDRRTGGIGGSQTIRYPIGPKPKGKGVRSNPKDKKHQQSSPPCVGQPTGEGGVKMPCGPVPPGLSIPEPPISIVAKEPKRQRQMKREPTPQISQDCQSLGGALDIWALIENASVTSHLGDGLF